MPDGSRRLVAETVPVNYRDSEGKWAPIDITLVDPAGGGERFAARNEAADYTAKIPQNPARTPVRFASGGDWVKVQMAGLTGSPRVEGSTATFEGLEGTPEVSEVVYEATGSGLKESIVLESAPQPGAGGDERDDEQEGEQGRAGVSFAYELTTSPGVVAELADQGMVVLRDTADPKAGPRRHRLPQVRHPLLHASTLALVPA